MEVGMLLAPDGAGGGVIQGVAARVQGLRGELLGHQRLPQQQPFSLDYTLIQMIQITTYCCFKSELTELTL